MSRSSQAGTPLGSALAVREMFAQVACRYDFLNRFLTGRRDVAWRRETAKSLAQALSRPGSVVADVCCGTGDLAFEFTRHSNGIVIGADFCHPMLERAESKLAHNAKNTSTGRSASLFFLEADTLSLPFPDNCLDAVASAWGFRNLTDYDRGFREMWRVLKPGGSLAILECSQVQWPVFGPLYRLYFRQVVPRLGRLISGVDGAYQYLPDSVANFPDQESLAAAMREAGFKSVRYRNFFGGATALHLGEKP